MAVSAILPPRRYWAQAGGNAFVLGVLLALGVLARSARRTPVAARKATIAGALAALGLPAGAFVAWQARRTAMLAERLAEEQERRHTFVSVVAHELKNRMTPLQGYSQILSRQPEAPREQQRRAAEAIVRETHHLSRLVADLLDVSRLQGGRLAIQREPMDLVELARSVVEAEQRTTERHRVLLEGPAHLEGVWDRDRIAQVLSNLVNNAVKYSPDGGEVRVSVGRTDRQAQVSVADQGVGLTPEQIGLLFEPYSRLYRERRAKGVGLGLYISRGIVDSHGGRIWATSAGPDQGSTFAFTLPLGSEARERR